MFRAWKAFRPSAESSDAYFATGESPGATGSARISPAPYQAFRASDGWINIGGANQANWERIADVLGHRTARRSALHQSEVLREFGYQDAEIDRLVAEGVVEDGTRAEPAISGRAQRP